MAAALAISALLFVSGGVSNILYISRAIVPPWNEGSKALVWQLAAHLSRHRAGVLTTPTAVLPPTAHPLDAYPIYTNPRLTAWQKLRLLRFLQRPLPQADVLHLFFVPTPLTSRLLRYGRRRFAQPVVQTVPSLPPQLDAATAQQLFFGQRVVVYRPETAVRLRQLGIHQAVHIDVGIDVARYERATAVADLRQRLGCAPDDVLVLFSGEYSRLGAVDRLRAIMPQVLAQAPNAHFVFACRLLLPTDAPIKAALQSEVAAWGLAHRIHFLGEVADFAALLKTADLFIYPVTDMAGKIETPLTLLEAMAAGLPVLLTDAPPLDTFLPDAAVCRVAVADEAALVTALVQLIAQPARRRALAQRGRAHVQQQFGVGRMVAAYEALYDELA